MSSGIGKASKFWIVAMLPAAACCVAGGCNAEAKRTMERQEEEISQLREECGRRKQALLSAEELISGMRRELDASKAAKEGLLERVARLETDLEYQNRKYASLETVRLGQEEELRSARMTLEEGAQAQDSAARLLSGASGLLESARTATEIRGAIPEGDPRVRVSMRSLLALSHVVSDAGARIDQAAALLRLRGPRLGPTTEGEKDPETLRLIAATPLDPLLAGEDQKGEGNEEGADPSVGVSRLAWSATKERAGFWGRAVDLVQEHLSRLFQAGRRWDASDYGFLGTALLALVVLALLAAIPFRLVLRRPRERELALLRRIVGQMEGAPPPPPIYVQGPLEAVPAGADAVHEPCDRGETQTGDGTEPATVGTDTALEAPPSAQEAPSSLELPELQQTQVLPDLGTEEPPRRAPATVKTPETRAIRRRELGAGDQRDTTEPGRAAAARRAPPAEEPAATAQIGGGARAALEGPAATQEIQPRDEVPRPPAEIPRPEGRAARRELSLTRELDPTTDEQLSQTQIIGSPEEIGKDLEKALGMTQEVGTPTGEDSTATQAIPEAQRTGLDETQCLAAQAEEEFTRTQPVEEGKETGLSSTQPIDAPLPDSGPEFSATQVIPDVTLEDRSPSRAPDGVETPRPEQALESVSAGAPGKASGDSPAKRPPPARPARVPKPRPSPEKRPPVAKKGPSLSSEKDLLAELEQLMGRKLDGPKK